MSRVYFRQLLAGRDFAVGDPMATAMVNFVYAMGDRETGEAVLVDPAYRPSELVAALAADDMTLVGAIGTHYHFDHVGGDYAGHHVDGVVELLEIADVPIHVQRDEVEWVAQRTGVGEGSLVAHEPGDTLAVGGLSLTLIHTPGHTPGSQCLLFEGRLVSGDTLFLDGCGRTDLPGSDPEEMYRTLTQRLAFVDDATILFPGHFYSPQPDAPMSEVRASNRVLAPASADQWLAMFS
ncbi:MAG TPA: MBL fold metallo-hydrolase [Acidimicrobiales bacterium]|nr:MBL fold metallo-hydrolase [Acidimicrobiales bacterium]